MNSTPFFKRPETLIWLATFVVACLIVLLIARRVYG